MMDNEEVLKQELQHPDPAVRKQALDSLGELKLSNGLDLIKPSLRDRDISVRATAAFNLGELKNQQSIPILLKLLDAEDDPSETVKEAAITSLDNFRDPTILQALVLEANKQHLTRPLLQEIARQLKNYNNDVAREVLTKLLHSEDRIVQFFAAESLLHINSPSLKVVWEEALGGYNHQEAKQALLQIANWEGRPAVEWLGKMKLVSDAQIVLVEKQVQVKFPLSFIKCIKNYHGLYPVKNLFDLSIPNYETWIGSFGQLLSLDPGSSAYILTENEQWHTEISKSLILFATNHLSDYLFLDYTELNKNSEPFITYFSPQEDYLNFVKVANNFDAFLTILHT